MVLLKETRFNYIFARKFFFLQIFDFYEYIYHFFSDDDDN